MNALAGASVLTASQMRGVEAKAVAEGTSEAVLMERAGAGIARWTARLAAGSPVTILCGPGNNGGYGYVAARLLRAGGVAVTVAAWAEPRTQTASDAARQWAGPIEPLAKTRHAPVVVDALLGTGASRGIDEPRATDLIHGAGLAIGVDLPSGLHANSGRPMGKVARCHVTLALGALKPAHLLQSGAELCGSTRLVDIGLATTCDVHVLAEPFLSVPRPTDHKYTRGMVAVVAGAMSGAAELAAEAALRAGAGYVLLAGGSANRAPQALVRRPLDEHSLADERIGCVVVGPGLGRDADARTRLAMAVASNRPLVIDGDAIHLLDPANIPADSILTPHAGEFTALFGTGEGSKLDRTRAAARANGTVIVHKGADTVIAAPDGRAVIAPPTTAWLSTAGTGDVLAGAIAAQRAAGGHAFMAAQAGVWLHARAAERLGRAFITDDLVTALSHVR